MKKIALLGDSIRLSYGCAVAEMFPECELVQPEDNCRFAKYTFRMLFDWSDTIKGSNVIHWNNGLWDVCDLFGDGTFSTIDEYVENMVRIAKQLKKITPNVIFATSTPVRDDNPYNRNEDIKAFNAAVVPALEREGIVINDLFGLLYEKRNEYISAEDKLHLTKEGVAVCAKKVAEEIRKMLDSNVEDRGQVCEQQDFLKKYMPI